ncbi:MAG: hypothetical protein OXI54_00100 [Chloroflexota bacterium]|nr:hypothetical protein [Chloroflexota bacterium]MDE2682540.1 hypothetical protein [Chloroflexota bacterium]
MNQPENCRPVEVRGQVRGVQMNPPGEGGGGTFQLLLEDGNTIVSPYPKEWHVEVGAAYQANDMDHAIVSGIGEYSPDGKLQRIHELKSFDTFRVPNWKEAFLRRGRIRASA